MIAWGTFLEALGQHPILLVSTVLTLGVILVNGWTDAPNAIATCVATRAMPVNQAIAMAAVFNFLGVLVMTSISASVTQTVYRMVDLGGDRRQALLALCAAMVAIVVWATAAWLFGIPTSESHALIAGLSGAAIALQGGWSGIRPEEWIKVVYGLAGAAGLGFGLGWGLRRATEWLFRGVAKWKATRLFRKAQIGGAAAMAFMHGAQDGQKFIGIFLLQLFLVRDASLEGAIAIPLWLMVLCSTIMGLGTYIGGVRIIQTMGLDMVKLDVYQGFDADAAAAGTILASTLFGLPVSTTHTKAMSIMGVGAARRLSDVDWRVARDMAITWLLTFPGCGLLGYASARWFLRVFS